MERVPASYFFIKEKNQSTIITNATKTCSKLLINPKNIRPSI
jgi:hypothetical protein